MSPKGVEHGFGWLKTVGKVACIHQCRRKALNTNGTIYGGIVLCVHSSMSPKGVEHRWPRPPESGRKRTGAFINVDCMFVHFAASPGR